MHNFTLHSTRCLTCIQSSRSCSHLHINNKKQEADSIHTNVMSLVYALKTVKNVKLSFNEVYACTQWFINTFTSCHQKSQLFYVTLISVIKCQSNQQAYYHCWWSSTAIFRLYLSPAKMCSHFTCHLIEVFFMYCKYNTNRISFVVSIGNLSPILHRG